MTCVKILLVAAQSKWAATAEHQRQILSATKRIQDLFKKLVMLPNPYNAARLAVFLLTKLEISPLDHEQPEFERLVSNSELPPALRVSVLLSLATNANSHLLYDICDNYLQRAEALLPTYQQVIHSIK